MTEVVTIDYDDILEERETEKAICFIIEGDPYHLPKSQITIDEEDMTVEMPRWLAKEKEFV